MSLTALLPTIETEVERWLTCFFINFWQYLFGKCRVETFICCLHHFLCYLAKKHVLSGGEHNRMAVLVALELGEMGLEERAMAPPPCQISTLWFFFVGRCGEGSQWDFSPQHQWPEGCYHLLQGELGQGHCVQGMQEFQGRTGECGGKGGKLFWVKYLLHC